MTPNTWYVGALAEKRTGTDIAASIPGQNFEIFTFFNSELGKPNCLPGRSWYYGLNTNTPPGQINLVETLLHEFGHGLGFLNAPTDELTGIRLLDFPSVWEQHMKDLTSGKRWLDMTDAELAASSVKRTFCKSTPEFNGSCGDVRRVPTSLCAQPPSLEPGSSVSHWDTSLFLGQLMEPFDTFTVSHQLTPPRDLTFSLLRDIGW